MPSRVRVLLAVAAAALWSVGCQVATLVDIRVDDDGSGAVTVTADLDAQAAARLGDPASELALDDLTAGGWTVRGPDALGDGGLRIEATKAFGSPDDLQSVLTEVGGDVFSDFEVSVASSFSAVDWSVDGRVRLSGTLDQFGDPDLTDALDGLPLGRTPEELAAELDDGEFPLSVRVELPEPVDDPADTTGTAASFPARTVTWSWSVPGDPVDVSVAARATRRDVDALRWMALGALALLVAAAAWVVGRIVVRRRSAVGGSA